MFTFFFKYIHKKMTKNVNENNKLYSPQRFCFSSLLIKYSTLLIYLGLFGCGSNMYRFQLIFQNIQFLTLKRLIVY